MKRSGGLYITLGMLCSIFLLGTIKVIQYIHGDGNVQINAGTGHIVNVQIDKRAPPSPIKIKPVRSELKLPDESILLERPGLIKVLQERVSQNPKGITAVALIGVVGMGGVGKTTLARMWGRLYGKKHQKASVWEINAETLTSLSNSFREIASALAQTHHQKNALWLINQIQDIEAQEKQRLNFVKNCLKEQPEWMLIFDNVESYKNIKNYLPHDPTVWGKGQVLITTRNAHLQDIETINTRNIINLEELTSEEVLKLFVRIRFKCEPEELSNDVKAQVQGFLKHIPPFPLDVSTTARYMTHYKLSYPEYLVQLNTQTNEFNTHQETLLKESCEYTKTRYGIITLTLKHIMEANKGFTNLLLLISLLDSQNIPTKLLEYCHTKLTTQQFLDELKKYSLITTETGTQDSPLFSLHRSTQEISRTYLVQTLQLTSKHPLIISITDKIETYTNLCIDEERTPLLKLLEPHHERLLNCSMLSAPFIKGALNTNLGCANYYLGNNLKAKQYFEQGIILLDKEKNRKNNVLAKAFSHLGMVYMEFGDLRLARKMFKHSVKIYKKVNDSTGYSRALILLGSFYTTISKYSHAKKVLKESIVISEKYSKSSTNLPFALIHLGEVYRELGNFQKAQIMTKRGVHLYEKVHSDMWWSIAYLGMIYEALGRYTEAIKLFEKGASTYKSLFADQNTTYAWFLTLLGNVYSNLDYSKAKDILERANNIFTISNNNSDLGWNTTHLGKINRKLGNYVQARKQLEDSKSLHIKIYGADNSRTAWVLLALGQLYIDLGNYKEAKEILEQSLKIFQLLPLHENPPQIGKILITLGHAYYYLNNFLKAQKFFQDGLSIYQNHYGLNHFRVAEPLRYLGKLYLAQGNIEKAEGNLQLSLKILKTNSEAPNHPDQHLTLESLATVYERRAEVAMKDSRSREAITFKQNAKDYLKEALSIAEAHFPKDSTHIQRIQNRLGQFD